MPSEPGADFVALEGSTVFTDSTLRRWRLSFDETTDPPTPVFAPVLTWADMKLRFTTWAAATAPGFTWGIAKGL